MNFNVVGNFHYFLKNSDIVNIDIYTLSDNIVNEWLKILTKISNSDINLFTVKTVKDQFNNYLLNKSKNEPKRRKLDPESIHIDYENIKALYTIVLFLLKV